MPVSNETLEYIRELKKKHDAVIIAHNYQMPDVQDIADLLGDSLALATEASKMDSKIIIFCGVNFMAETAKILSPQKVIIHPEPDARCPMADMVEIPFLREMKSKHPDAVVVSYVNTTADVKAESDVCCTSGNAVKVIKSVREKKIIFTPDRNLGMYVQRFVPEKEIILWPGFCAVHHNKITVAKLESLKSLHPEAEVMVHPECTPEVIDYADCVFSTHGMLVHAKKSDAAEFILGTEKEMTYRLSKDIPGKQFYAVEDAVCQNMKKITLEKVIKSLETLEPKVEISKDILERARKPLDRMVEIGRGE
ncbi:MAG: quinolinate synthase NadA [Candidatus Thermoplasmatota archaeon]|nr:quinolinate synthase NadA [Euryarchaeota archaeon]MBU4031256.1 quinolinate synthase NadA [Candidatus Thermoplasmatota archaeon]MBU4072258.1 quinolinate synthase NadA [Candidatus Thermoplasmatota archaeon]MBU4144959.1 quinolinate synthase NadA [Candidatus Thermoplasmatota archaeon]MBU4592051.1 quinolinate synthase NadA [Candidatus Thermoplasmatota archaeon]